MKSPVLITITRVHSDGIYVFAAREASDAELEVYRGRAHAYQDKGAGRMIVVVCVNCDLSREHTRHVALQYIEKPFVRVVNWEEYNQGLSALWKPRAERKRAKQLRARKPDRYHYQTSEGDE